MRNYKCRGFGCCLNERRCTDFEVAELDLAVGAGPEVDLDLGPDWSGEVELEGDLPV